MLFYKWKVKYGGMDASGGMRLDRSDARGVKALEDENERLKELLAELMLNESALRELFGKMDVFGIHFFRLRSEIGDRRLYASGKACF